MYVLMYLLGHILLGLNQELHEVPCEATIGVVEEWCGDAEVAHTSGTTDAVHVLLNVRRQIKVYHVTHVRDIQTYNNKYLVKNSFKLGSVHSDDHHV